MATLATLASLFLEAGAVACEDAADANDDGLVNLSDVVFTLDYLFRGGDQPEPPFRRDDIDPTPDDLGCLVPAERD